VVVRLKKRRRRYWTGAAWSKNVFDAKYYLRKEAEHKARQKHGFVITIGFRY